MQSFSHYRLKETNDGIEIIIFLNDRMTEVASELGTIHNADKDSLEKEAIRYTKNHFPKLKVKAIKVMAGALLVTTIGFVNPPSKAEASANIQQTTAVTYQVSPGDTLWKLAQRYNTTVDEIRKTNQLTSDLLRVGQTLTIQPSSQQQNTYIVVSGDTLWKIASNHGTTVNVIKQSNNLQTDVLHVGQALIIPSNTTSDSNTTQTNTTYHVVAGDSLWQIAMKNGTTVDAIKNSNNLASDSLTIGQQLFIPSSTNGSPTTNRQVENHINQEDIEWLAKIIYAESRGESLNGQIAVGAVIVNRTKSNQFPNTIKEVIFEKSYGYYQFSPAGNGELTNATPNGDSYEAARRALSGEDPTNGSLYFYNPSKTGDSWVKSRTVSTTIGNHVFAF